MPHSVEQCRKLAAEYRRRSDATDDAWLRAEFLKLAFAYENLAKEADEPSDAAAPAAARTRVTIRS